MAFIYCNQRWNHSKENNFPGPSQYTLPQPNLTQSTPNIPTRLIKSMKNKRAMRLQRQTIQKQLEKQSMDRKMMELNQNNTLTHSKMTAKKGKLYRNRSVEFKRIQENECQHTVQFKAVIKNAFHSHPHTSSRNKWGNMRIKEMLNQHHTNQINKNTGKLLSKHNRSNLFNNTSGKVRQQLKDMQNIFTTHRKGYNANMQHFNQCKSPAKKILSRAISQNQLRLSDNSVKEFQIEPALVYKSEKYQEISFTKNNITYSTPTCSIGSSKVAKEHSIPTGLQQDTFDEDSMEYISDATPGPGSYNIHSEVSKISSRIQKFGVTMERFRPQKQVCPTLIVPIYPQYKVSSNAKQQDVGFGRSTKDQQQKVNFVHNGIFYQDCNTLQNKSKKTLLKKKGDKVCFDSGKDRFPLSPTKHILESEQQSDSSLLEQGQVEQQQKPTCVFMSKVNRQLGVNNTLDVQFSGQNANCIANKLKKQKQHYQDYDITQPAFLTNSKRFIYQEVKPEEKKEQLLGIKIKQLKKKKEIKVKKVQKGYSFGKQIKHEGSVDKSQNMPSPDKYQKTAVWIKPSYNVRFN